MSQLLRDRLSDVLRSAVAASLNPAMAAADWLARDIDPACQSAVDLLTRPDASLDDLRKAKDVYKTMRILGETAADRRLAARLYAAAIASALVHHSRQISRQSNSALRRALSSLHEDQKAPDPLRQLAGTALCHLGGKA